MEINVIFGPPGTGKTYRLMELLEKELQNYSPEEIAYVSYTREGAYQGRDRAIKAFDYTAKQFPYFKTLHSIAFGAMNLRRSDVLGKKDYRQFSEKMGMKFTGYYTEDLRHDDDMYLFFQDLHKNNHKTAKNYLSMLDVDKLEFVKNNYRRYKEYFSKIDYTDMICLFNKANNAIPVKVAFIDEAQDLTTLQWQMVWTAFKHCDKIYIAGDDDQAIYQWSGADVEYFLNLEGNMEILKHSHRVPNNLLHVPQSITKLISKRIDKKYDGIDKKGNLYFLNHFSEAPIKNGDSWLILSRNNYFLKEVETWVRSKGIIYSKKGTVSVSQEKVDIINLFERVRRTKMMTNDEEVKLKQHLREDFNIVDPWYNNLNWHIDEITYYRDIIANKTKLTDVTIKIGTIHSAKGDEAENVLLLTDITKSVAANLDNNPDSEHRCFYVGVTRASKNLFIVNPTSKYNYSIA